MHVILLRCCKDSVYRGSYGQLIHWSVAEKCAAKTLLPICSKHVHMISDKTGPYLLKSRAHKYLLMMAKVSRDKLLRFVCEISKVKNCCVIKSGVKQNHCILGLVNRKTGYHV